MNDKLTAVAEAAEMLSDAQSGFIPGCGEDERWQKKRDALVLRLREQGVARRDGEPHSIPLGTINNAMVHKMCHYLRADNSDGVACQKCPANVDTPYGKGELGCYGVAFETLQMARSFMYESAAPSPVCAEPGCVDGYVHRCYAEGVRKVLCHRCQPAAAKSVAYVAEDGKRWTSEEVASGEPAADAKVLVVDDAPYNLQPKPEPGAEDGRTYDVAGIDFVRHSYHLATIATLQSSLDDARRELENANERLAELHDLGQQASNRADEAEAENARLREQFTRYAKHDYGCTFSSNNSNCSCGVLPLYKAALTGESK